MERGRVRPVRGGLLLGCGVVCVRAWVVGSQMTTTTKRVSQARDTPKKQERQQSN